MPWKVYPALILLAAFLLPLDVTSQRNFRYKMYRNPPKPLLGILPVQSPHLAQPAREMITEALRREAENFDRYKPISILGDSSSLSPNAIQKLRNETDIDYILRSVVGFENNRYTIFSELLNTNTMESQASYFQACNCPIGEVVYWLIPDAVKQLKKASLKQFDHCPSGMVEVPESFISRLEPITRDTSDTSGAEGDSVTHTLKLSAFCMDKWEYPNRVNDYPVVDKTWEEAAGLCSEQGKRLCSETEWERTCRDAVDQEFPYAGKYDAKKCNAEGDIYTEAGHNKTCSGKLGIEDLSGNVSEWTSTAWGENYGDFVVRGGFWQSGQNSSCSKRYSQSSKESQKSIGFRCCATLTQH